MRKLLYIAYYFPPLGGAGVQRTLKFVKYLPAFGWLPHLLTVDPNTGYVQDPSLEREIPAEVPVTRIPDPLGLNKIAAFLARLPGVWPLLSRLRQGKPGNPQEYIRSLLRRYCEMPDAQLGWAKNARHAGLRLLADGGFDAIVSSSVPYSDHLLAKWLKDESGLPWLADFRDEWSQNPYIEHFTPLHPRLHRRLESQVLATADRVISVSEPITQGLAQLAARPGKFSTITNGFDADDIQAAQAAANPARTPVFRLAYAGSLYGYQTPMNIIHALEGLFQEGALQADEIRLRCIGRMGAYRFENPAWQPVLETPGYMQHEKALVQLAESNALLLIIPNQRGEGTFTGKIFEYIALQKPILALVPPQGVAAGLLRQSGCGVIVDPDDIPAIRQAVLELVGCWRANQPAIHPDPLVIAQYERRQLTHSLAGLLDEMVS